MAGQQESPEKLGRFMDGFVAAVDLLHRAASGGFFIEYVCLAASVIDGTLRSGLVLQHQLQNRDRTVPVPVWLIYEEDLQKGTSERQIYKTALKEQVVTRELFDKLESLYKRRNRVIHRYIISDISTPDVLDIAMEYESIIPVVSAAVRVLEDRQVASGTGMTIDVDASEAELRDFLGEMADRKHGALSEAMRHSPDSNADSNAADQP